MTIISSCTNSVMFNGERDREREIKREIGRERSEGKESERNVIHVDFSYRKLKQ